MARVCKAAQPNGVLRCERDWGHNGDHEAAAAGPMPGQLGEARTVAWPSARGEKEARKTSQARVNRETSKQAYRRGRLDGIRDQRLADQQREYLTGLKPFPSYCEKCQRETRAEALRLHHVIHRSQGTRATEDAQGDERPEDLVLECQGPGSCHDADHPGPWEGQPDRA